MTKIILHGGFTRDDNESNRSYYREITKDLGEGSTVLVVLFAREVDEYPDLMKDEINKLTQSTNKHLNIVQASEDEFMKQVKGSDAVVIRGGDTAKLMEVFKRHPEFMEAVKDKVVAGSSAGAYLFSRYYHSGTRNKVFEGLGILPIRIACHYGSKELEGRGNPLEQLEEYPHDLELVVLKDYEWRVFEI